MDNDKGWKRNALAFVASLVCITSLSRQFEDTHQRLQQFVNQQLGLSHHDDIPTCGAPGYTTRIVMFDPFIMHIENFVSAKEREYLLKLG